MSLEQINPRISDTMTACAESIMSKKVETSAPVFGVQLTRKPVSGQYDIFVEFHGTRITDNSPFLMSPLDINKLVVEQNFTENYMDVISLNVSFLPEQLLTFVDNYRNLRATLIIRYVRATDMWIDMDEPCLNREYLVVLKDKDIRKRINKQVMIPESGLDSNNENNFAMFSGIEVQLIDERAYNLRKQKFNFQLRDVTVKQTILWVAQCCKITHVHMPEPDNKVVYKNMVLPPTHTFESAMRYISEQYGVYAKGLGFYYTNDVLYIYRAYDVNVPTDSHAHFYYIGHGKYTGCDLYHAYAGDIAHIVINKAVNIKDMMDSGIETVGNDFTIQDANKIIDKYTTIQNANNTKEASLGIGRLSVNESNSVRFNMTDDTGIMDDAYNAMFFYDQSNPYKIQSYMHAYRRSFYGFDWEAAVPYTFKPGHLISYHYDGEDIMRREQGVLIGASLQTMLKTGIVENTTYVLIPVAKQNNKYVYACVANILLSMQSENAIDSPQQALDTTTVDTTSGTGISKRPGSGTLPDTFGGPPGSYTTMSGVVMNNEYDGVREDALYRLKEGKFVCPHLISQHFPECFNEEQVLAKYGNTGLPATNKAKQRQSETQNTPEKKVSLF